MEDASVEMVVEENNQVTLVNKTGKEVKWESSDNSVATVDGNGNVKAIARGSAIITACTVDKKHRAKCEVTVKDVTDYITTYYSGGQLFSDSNGMILYGSFFYWYIQNGTSNPIKLQSLQLIDGVTGATSPLQIVNAVISPGNSGTYTVKVGITGIHTPLTCRYMIWYNGKTYVKDVVYKSGDMPGWWKNK